MKINRRTPVNKRSRKPKGQSRMDNPETLATLGTQTQDEDNQHKTTQITQKSKKMSNNHEQYEAHQNDRVNRDVREG